MTLTADDLSLLRGRRVALGLVRAVIDGDDDAVDELLADGDPQAVVTGLWLLAGPSLQARWAAQAEPMPPILSEAFPAWWQQFAADTLAAAVAGVAADCVRTGEAPADFIRRLAGETAAMEVLL